MGEWMERVIGETQFQLLRLLRRSRRTITGLAEELGLTDNAVRTHVSALGRDGLVAQVGTARDTGGKPARLYAITRAGDEVFPKGYAAVLGGVVDGLVARLGESEARAFLGTVGAEAVGGAVAPADGAAGAREAVRILSALGAEAEIEATENGWLIKGYGCPLSAVTADHAALCAVATGIVATATGRPVEERCDRSDRPRCAFHVARE